MQKENPERTESTLPVKVEGQSQSKLENNLKSDNQVIPEQKSLIDEENRKKRLERLEQAQSISVNNQSNSNAFQNESKGKFSFRNFSFYFIDWTYFFKK